MDYPTGTVLSIRLYLPEETFWYGSYYYYYYPATFTVNDNLTFDFTTAMDYCQQVKGIKFSGLAFTLSDNFNDVLDGTITFYDAEGNALGQTALAYQSYYVPGATSFKVQSENVARLSLVVDEVAMKKSAENAGKATQLTPVTEEEPDDSSGTDDSQPSDDQNGDIADGSGANDSQPGDSADNNGTGDTQPDQSVSGEDQPGDVPSEETPAKVKKPVIVSAKKKTKTSMTIKWKDLSAASGYQIQYSTSSKFAASKTKTVNKAAGVTSVTVKKLLKGKKYYVRMRAYRTVDQMKYFTKWSAKKTVKM
jgi:hypothetical protein